MYGPEEPDFARRALPSELDAPLPRKVQMNSADASGLLIIAVVCLGMGGAICVYFGFSTIAQIQQRAALRKNGRDTAGIVNDMHAGHGDATVSYAFLVNGVKYRGRAEMPEFDYSHSLIFHESEQIAVRYLPSNPAVNHPAAWEWSGLSDLVPNLFVLFFTSVGILAFAGLLRDRKLDREGSAVEGVVTGCAPNKKTQFRVEYEFRTENDIRTRGSCDCWEKYDEGDRIWILYLANKPQRNHSYPLLYFGIRE